MLRKCTISLVTRGRIREDINDQLILHGLRMDEIRLEYI